MVRLACSIVLAAALLGCPSVDPGGLLPPGGVVRDAGEDVVSPSDGGPPDSGMRDGGDAGPPPLEDPGACTMIPYYGQSSSVGVCSGTCTNFGDPPCDVPGGSLCNVLSDRDLEGGFQAAWNNATNDYGDGVCALNVRGGAGCARGNAEISAYGMIEQYRKMLGDPPEATFTSVAGQSGTSIADLDRGEGVAFSPTQAGYQLYYGRLIRSVIATKDAVAADPERFGCNGNVVVRGIALTQGETDDPSPEGYTERVRRFVDNFCEDVRSVTGQQECPHVSWDQTSGWLANGDALAPTAQRLNDAADPDPRFHSIGGKGQYNPGTPGNPFIGESNPDGVHSWENNGASPLHFSSLTQKHVGRQHGKILYRGIHLGEQWNGLRMNVLTQEGRTLTACFNPVGGRIVRDVLNCPPHWNGADGFEWHQDEIGGPRIVNVRQSTPRCLELEMSAPVSNVASGRLQAGFRGLARIGDGEEPENGCREPDGTVNEGAPGWTNWRDADPADFDGDGAAYNWVAIQAKPLDRGGVPPATDSSPAYLSFDRATQLIAFPDDRALSGSAMTVSWWAQHESLTDNAVVLSKWGEFLIRRQSDGQRIRYNALFDRSGANSSVWADFEIEPSSEWTHLAMIYDGTQVATQRVRWFKDCVEVTDNERAGIPATLPDTNGLVTIGDGQSKQRTVIDGLRDVAIWPAALSESELLRICRSRGDLRSLGGAPAPRYFVRPTCDDDLTAPDGVKNLGTLGNTGSGTGMNQAQLVVDRPGVCDGVDGGVRDGGVPRDAGTRDGGVPATVPNIFGVACDGVDDRVTYGAQAWLDGRDEALICFLVRQPEYSAAGRPLGHWETNGEQWGVLTEQSNLRFYAASSGQTERYAATEDEVMIPGPHQHYCVRYDLRASGVADEVRAWRNGAPVAIERGVGGPGSVFSSPGGPGFSLCAEHGGGNEWEGVIDEVAIWLDGNIPTDAQIADEVAFDATPWDCVLPNWAAGGRPTAPPADIVCRFESSFECVDGRGAAVATGAPVGGPTFTTETACHGTYENFTSLPFAAGDSYETPNWIQDPADQNVVACWASERATPAERGVVVGQLQGGAPTASSWGIVQSGDRMRVHVSDAPNSNDEWVEFEVEPTGRHQYCVVFNLGGADKVRLVEDCAARPVVDSSGELPSSFVYNAGGRTIVGATTDGAWRWTGGHLDNLVVWREQDGEPSFADVTAQVCGPRTNYEALPGIPPPGCWFPLDGALTDRLTNCDPLVPRGAAPAWGPANPLD